MAIKDYCYYASKIMDESWTNELVYCCAPEPSPEFCDLEKCPKKEEYINIVGIKNYF